MALYTMKEILKDAQEKCYGVGYYNAVSLEMVRAYIRAAEDEKSPIIIGTAEGLLNYGDLDWLMPIMSDAARHAKVPVALHFDHGYSFEVIMKALRAGFGSVMFDGSSLDYEENVRISKEITKIAHPMGVGVECELGKVGGLDEGEGVSGENIYTDPNLANDFVDRTDTDFLAISIGTVHGVYAEKPKLDLELLSKIRSNVNCPLVLHGGSGLSVSDFKNCIKHGISKVNIFTDVIQAAIDKIRSDSETLNYMEVMKVAEQAMYDATVEKINIFGSKNRG